MFQSGSQINPALGRTDYSAYTQGAAQGASQIGQGMSQLGAGIGAAVHEYRKKKEEKELSESLFEKTQQAVKDDPSLAEFLPFNINSKEEYGVSVKAAGGSPAAAALLSSVMQHSRQKKEDAAIGSFVTGGTIPEGKIGDIFKNNPHLVSKAVSEKTKYDMSNLQLLAAKQGIDQNSFEFGEKQKDILARNISLFVSREKDPARKLEMLGGVDPLIAQKALTYADQSSQQSEAGRAALAHVNAQTNALNAQAASSGVSKLPTPEAGLRWNNAGTAQEVIPGGSIDIKNKEAAITKKEEVVAADKAQQELGISAANNLAKIKDAAKLVRTGNMAAGLGSGVAGWFGGSDAADLRTKIASIQSSIAIDKIMELKKASKTGSTGFGALNLKELEALQSEIANLDQSQSEKQLIGSLETIYSHYGRVMGALPKEYQFEIPSFNDTTTHNRATKQPVNPNASKIKY